MGAVRTRFAARPGLGIPAGIEELEADQGTGQVEQPLQQVGAPLVAHAEAAAAEQPGEAALDDPAVPPQPFGGVDATAGDPRGDAAGTQRAALLGGVVRLVRVQLGRTLPRTTRSSARA